MSEIERLLEGAGERWRAAQPGAPEIDSAVFMDHRHRRARFLPFATMAIAAVAIAAVLATSGFGGAPGNGPAGIGGGTAEPTESMGSTAPASPVTTAACDLTRPEPPFVPPAPNPASPGATTAWYGTPALWTMLDRDGETWEHLPVTPDGLTQKTFWWSTDWVPEANPVPDITVVGTQLDGPGSFTVSRGTNALTDAGQAMLVGVTVPTPGCWRLTGTYLDASLSIVVLVKGD